MRLVPPTYESVGESPRKKWRDALFQKQLQRLTSLKSAELKQWSKVLEELIPSLHDLDLLWLDAGDEEGLLTEYTQELEGVDVSKLYWSPSGDGMKGGMSTYLRRMGFDMASITRMKEEMNAAEDIDIYSYLFQYLKVDLKVYIAYFWLLAEKKGDLFAHKALEELIGTLVKSRLELMSGYEEIENERRGVKEDIKGNTLLDIEDKLIEKAVGGAHPALADRIKESITDRMLAFGEDLLDDKDREDQAVAYFSNTENVRKIATKIIAARPKV